MSDECQMRGESLRARVSHTGSSSVIARGEPQALNGLFCLPPRTLKHVSPPHRARGSNPQTCHSPASMTVRELPLRCPAKERKGSGRLRNDEYERPVQATEGETERRTGQALAGNDGTQRREAEKKWHVINGTRSVGSLGFLIGTRQCNQKPRVGGVGTARGMDGPPGLL